MKASGKIVIRHPTKHANATNLQEESVHIFPVNSWISILILIPLVLVAVALTAFFFSAFLALFLIAGSILGAWIWWWRRKLRKHAQSESLESEYVVIKETHIVDTKTDKAEDL